MNAFQVGVHKQYSHGFMINAEYQWTRVTGTENLENPSGANPNDSSGNIAGITPQVFVVSYSYALPIGTGQALFGGASNFVNKFIGGWQISGITSFQTGQPFSVTYTAPGSPVGLVSGRANRSTGSQPVPGQEDPCSVVQSSRVYRSSLLQRACDWPLRHNLQREWAHHLRYLWELRI